MPSRSHHVATAALATLSFTVLGWIGPAPASAHHCGPVVLLPGCSHVPPVSSRDAQPDDGEVQLTDEAGRVVELINASRADAGLPSLERLEGAAEFARPHSLQMARAGDIWHNHEHYLTPAAKQQLGVDRVSENVGMAATVERMHELFMQSDGHRANILDPRLTHVGVAVAVDDIGGRFVTQAFAGIDPRPVEAASIPETTPPQPTTTTTAPAPAPPEATVTAAATGDARVAEPPPVVEVPIAGTVAPPVVRAELEPIASTHLKDPVGPVALVALAALTAAVGSTVALRRHLGHDPGPVAT